MEGTSVLLSRYIKLLVIVHENMELTCNLRTDLQKAAKKKLFAESKILNYFVQMALGLHYMHG